MRPWRRKSLATLNAEVARGQGFRRSLTAVDLCILGIGVVVGTGIFVLTGKVACNHAGPAVTVSLMLAALAAGLGALCYAEVAALIPAAGSVYTYCFAALGEVVAFVIAWDLVVEYTFGAATVAVGWAAYVAGLAAQLGCPWLPSHLVQAPWRWDAEASGWVASGAFANLPAAAAVLAVTALVATGGSTSRWAGRLLVATKIGAIVLFVAVAAAAVRPENWSPFLPANRGPFGAFGISGVAQGAAMLFFSYCGVEALSAASVEAKDPQRALPRAIVVTLVVCLVLYLSVAAVLTGVVPAAELGVADPLAVASRATGARWLAPVVSVAAIAGFTSVMMVQLYCQPRVLFAMAADGLLPAPLAALHPILKTPWRATWLTGGVAAGVAAAFPVEALGEMCSVATLLAFIAVAACAWRLRALAPAAPRVFRLPAGRHLVPGATVLVCGALAAAARLTTIAALASLLALALAAYLATARWRTQPQQT